MADLITEARYFQDLFDFLLSALFVYTWMNVLFIENMLTDINI